MSSLIYAVASANHVMVMMIVIALLVTQQILYIHSDENPSVMSMRICIVREEARAQQFVYIHIESRSTSRKQASTS